MDETIALSVEPRGAPSRSIGEVISLLLIFGCWSLSRDSHHTCRHPSSRLTLISPKIYTYSSLLQVYNKHSVLHTRIHLWASLLISLHALTDWIGPAIGMDYVYATSLLLIAGPALDRLVAVTSQIEKKEKKRKRIWRAIEWCRAIQLRLLRWAWWWS
jgi:hypothetical protein